MNQLEYPSYDSRILQLTRCISNTFDDDTKSRLWNLASYIVEPYRESFRQSKPLIMTVGNGGSHALAEHLTGELIWRLSKDQKIGIPSICLNSNASVVTALLNDVETGSALGSYVAALSWLSSIGSTSILIGFSTSGESQNILDLFEEESYEGLSHKVLFLGIDKNREFSANEIFYVKGPSDLSGQIIQEVHQVYVHILCEMIAEQLQQL